MPTLLDAQSAVEQGNTDQARLIYQALLQDNPRDEEAWLGLAEVVTDEDDKRVCYENVLKINKNNRAAKEGLRNLEPKEDPLVAALASQSFGRSAIGADEDDFTEVSPAYTSDLDTDSGETPPMILVAVGLALSVVVFALFGGIVFFTLVSLTTP
jgi:thioredoxin-like negative regulator of GroEL